jgi:hypothetical protein
MNQERVAEVNITCGAGGMADRSMGACFYHRRTRRGHVESLVACWGQDTGCVDVGADTYTCRCVVGPNIGEEKERE